jgi:hypothetical protein
METGTIKYSFTELSKIIPKPLEEVWKPLKIVPLCRPKRAIEKQTPFYEVLSKIIWQPTEWVATRKMAQAFYF